MVKSVKPSTTALTHLNKHYFKEHTKGDMIAYYDVIAPYMLPFMKDHPLMMQRFPEGIEGESFYQKNSSPYFPDWIKRITIEKKEGTYEAPVCQNKETLIYLANQGCITFHLWLSQAPALSRPDRIIFDLDPEIDDFSQVRKLALVLKEYLEKLNLVTFPMLSGSRGIHIYIPVQRTASYANRQAFAHRIAQNIINQDPRLATLEIRKEKREGKIFIDTLRNHEGATSVAPYSVRARENAPLAMPISWQEVEDYHLDPQRYTLSDVQAVVSRTDPWKDYFSTKQTITQAYKALKEGS